MSYCRWSSDMKPLCSNTQEFMEVIDSFRQMNDYHFNKNREKGFTVTTKVRKDFLTSEHQGKITMNGRVEDVKFDNLGGGVWRAYF